MILEHYAINCKTLALIPSKAPDFDTIVLEGDRSVRVKQTAYQMINEACRVQDCTTYAGRRDAVAQIMNYHKKVPIPVNIQQRIYSFPTHAPKHLDCCWLFANHIETISRQRGAKQATILFTNEQTIDMNVSVHTLEKQLYRTLSCMMIFSDNRSM